MSTPSPRSSPTSKPVWQTRCARAVFLAAAGVLLVAAWLKASGRQPNEPQGFIPRQWEVPAIYLELALGTLLLTGLYPASARIAAAGVFSVFSCVSAWNGIAGSRSCGCLGPVSISPWVVAAFDLTVVVLLVTLPPPFAPRRVPFRAAGGICMFVAGIVSTGWLRDEQLVPGQAIVAPSPVEFGVIRRASKVDASLSLSNESAGDIRVAEIESSCPCLSIALDRLEIKPGEVVGGQVVLDLGMEPAFVGNLSIDVTGRSADRHVLFRLKANASVRK